MRKTGCFALLTALLLAFAVPMLAASFDIQITTGYGFTDPFTGSTFLGGGTPSPDTGFVEITNLGTTTFVGSLGTIAVSNFAGDLSFSVSGYTLAPGASVSIAIGNESSNVGGFNGPFGSTQPGVEVFLNGLFNGSSANLSVNDSNIHSGVSRTSPCNGVSGDSYVLQGGASTGCDNGDAFETTQTFGTFIFKSGTSNVPEPASLALFGTGLAGLAGVLRRKLIR